MLGNLDFGGVWVFVLSYYDGKFWLIYFDVKELSGSWKDVNNYLIICDIIDGKWIDLIYLNSLGFDFFLFYEEDGKKYLVNMVWDYCFICYFFYGIVF